MDSKRHESNSKSNTESSPAPPSPPTYSSSYTMYDSCKNRTSSRCSPTSSDYRSSRPSQADSPQERRRRKRSGSKSSPVRSHRRSRSGDREKDRNRDRDRPRKYSRRDRSKSRGRSRSRDRRRSRSCNKSRERHRYRESRRHHRAPSYESDVPEDHAETIIPQPVVPSQSNAFKNDGSFMEMFKKMQEQMQPAQTSTASVLEEKTVVPPPLIVGKRRGGRILKTGMVAKPKTEQTVEQPKDACSRMIPSLDSLPSMQFLTRNAINPKELAKQPKTAPFDPRFPNQNQTRYCYSGYVDFHRCKKRHGEEYEACKYFQHVYRAMCPDSWVEKWDDQVEAGTFPGPI